MKRRSGQAYDDVHGTAAVVLDNFIGSFVGPATDDPGLIARAIVLDSNGILTHCLVVSSGAALFHQQALTVLEPYKFQCASTIAMHSLSLVLANNTVLQSSPFLKKEHSIGITTLSLVTASSATTVVPGPSAVERLTGSNSNDLAVCLGRSGNGNTAGVAVAGDN